MKNDDKFEINPMIVTNVLDDETEFIPLMTTDEDDNSNTFQVPAELPILPLRNTVLFPGVVIPITVSRDKSIKLIQESYRKDKIIGVISQKDTEIEEPGFNDLNKIGSVALIMKVLRMPDGNTTVIIQGKRRFEITGVAKEDPYIIGEIKQLTETRPKANDKNFSATVSSLKDLALQIIKQSPNIPSDAAFAIKNIESPSFLVNFIASNMNLPVQEKQKMLEIGDLSARATAALGHLTKELQMLELKNQIQSKVKVGIDEQQREYFLNQQLKTIQEELGVNSNDREVETIKEKAKAKKWGKEVQAHFDKEIQKLQRMNPQASEYSVSLNYLEVLTDLPWNEYTEDDFDLKKAKKILNRDHYGLDEVKERILEHLAVLSLKKDMKAPILCLYGPPGVGKTSLGKSIAEALGRKYVRMSLGGIRDEAEIRGHRKTYIGAMPGRIIQNLKKSKSSNPVFVLDEIDKVTRDNHGDPSSALLEVLDPEQNDKFYDNYVEMDYDLSKILFIATANSLSSIQPALRDRLEIIDVTGYTEEEKIEISKKHLIPKQIREHGLKETEITFDKEVIEAIIEGYTRESGVRSLEKKIAKVVRNQAKNIVIGEKVEKKVSLGSLQKILGPARMKDKYEGNDHIGVVTGLAWTSVGGDILFIEVSLSKGKGKLTLTGNLGDVMKESAMLALEYLKSHSVALGIDPEMFENNNVHVHVPEGATPKDGPSAGITMLTALASVFSGRKVKAKLAMTGEITLRGRVLPVGGIKEKILAAKRANIKEIILSDENKKDIEEINAKYVKDLKFHYVKNASEVLAISLLKKGK
ncbi:MAG: endopeptidase La [Bacteroidetes bacterium]|nr:endopeptidase La [Bacteroidota bacterium]